MRAPALTHERARELRRRMTGPEVMLWSRLRRRIPNAPAFRRQYLIGPYILDFYAPASRLAVEVDGSTHSEPGQEAYDARRDAWLRARGLTVYRITAASVREDLDETADGVRRMALELTRSR